MDTKITFNLSLNEKSCEKRSDILAQE